MPLFRIEVDREAIVKDTYYVDAPSLPIAKTFIEFRPDDVVPHREREVVEYLTDEEISDEGSVEVPKLPEGVTPYVAVL